MKNLSFAIMDDTISNITVFFKEIVDRLIIAFMKAKRNIMRSWLSAAHVYKESRSLINPHVHIK